MSTATRRHDLHVQIDDLRAARLDTTELADLESGQILLSVDQFGLSSNNVTYIAAARPFGNWRYFPVDARSGSVPVWGFATVIASRAGDVQAGERVFGFLPSSTHCTVDVGDADDRGLVDSADHRSWLPAVYNRYRRLAGDPMYAAEHEPYQLLLWPLFYTAYLFDNALVDAAFHGAKTVVLSSASSKTSIAVAKLLRRRDVRLAGLTSAPNRDFVERLRLFDQIAAYGEIDELPDRGPVLFVDVAGNKTVRRAVHERMAEQLVASITIGATHWDAEEEPEQPLPGPTPELFAAPAYIERRTAEWGADVLEERVAAGWQEFVADAPAWLRVEAHSGPDAVLALYGDVINGRVDPAVGHVASMWLSETAH